MKNIFAMAAAFLLFATTSSIETAKAAEIGAFTVLEIRFDESLGNKRPTPVIPKGWKFVGVSNGEKINSNNLWFQDQTGNIYVVRGFTSGRQFILDDYIGHLNVGR